MTITKKPSTASVVAPAESAAVKPAAPRKSATRKAKVAAPGASTAEAPAAFIEAATHVETSSALAPAPAAAAVDDPTKAKHKDKKKGKEKVKDKGKDKRKKKDKEAVLIRFEDDQLTKVDVQAESLGLSRAAWVRMVVAKALTSKR